MRAHLASCADAARGDRGARRRAAGPRSRRCRMVEPSPALKGRIMAAAAADLEARRTGGGLPPVAAVATPAAAAGARAQRRGDAVPERRRAERARGRAGPRRRSGSVRIAAVLAIVAPRRLEPAAPGTARRPRRRTRTDVAAVLEVASQPGAVTAILAPDDRRRSARAGRDRVRRATVTLAMRDLAPTTGDRGLRGVGDRRATGSPVPLGGFTVGRDGYRVRTTASTACPRRPARSWR